jgi:urease accessory protein
MQQFRLPKATRPVIAALSSVTFFVTILVLVTAAPAWAHHPSGGMMPTTMIEGFLSGLGHPVVGLDHLAFVVTAGLLATAVGQGLVIPVSFVLASLLGTGLHLMALNLPAPELFISTSVLLFGGLLALKRRPHTSVIAGLALLAGLFHGYAYGEAVIGAEAAPLFSYLLGFAAVQMLIAVATYGLAKRLVDDAEAPLELRFAGFTLTGVGAAFLSGVVLG